MSQLFYIHSDNPQSRLIKQATELLNRGAVLVYPTDSGYAIGCKLGDKAAMERIIRLRGLDGRHHFTLMCRDLSELATYAHVDNSAFRLLKNNTPGPYTFLLKATKEVPRRLLNEKRKTIGLRVTGHPVAQALLGVLDEPLMSATLIMPGNDFAESDPEEIQQRIGKQIDVILHGGTLGQHPTTVVDLTEEAPVIIRRGGGDCRPFE